jgi:hypothetical protein
MVQEDHAFFLSVQSMYKAKVQFVHSDAPVINNKHILKIKVPLQIKKNTWYLRHGVNLTKDNLPKHNRAVQSVSSVIMTRL